MIIRLATGILFGAAVSVALIEQGPLAASMQVQEFVDILGRPEVITRLSTTNGPLQKVRKDETTIGITLRVGDSCHIMVLASHQDDRQLLAHEACHCALDYQFLPATGYDDRIPMSAIILMEKRAKVCSKWLIDPRVEDQRLEARRTKTLPYWFDSEANR